MSDDILFDDHISPAILDLLRRAGKGDPVVCVTPYLKLYDRARQAIRSATDNRVRLTFLVRKDASASFHDDLVWLDSHGIRVYLLENLHAKVYWSPSRMIISSMNMHEASVSRSYEVAVVTRMMSDIREMRARINEWLSFASPLSGYDDLGYCIRCGETRSFNLGYPLCESCFGTYGYVRMAAGEDPFCHKCGIRVRTSYEKPLCKDCERSMAGPAQSRTRF
ncbi:MAG TPA: phospholipase D-like domain-containing protein [bacterium]|jgi:hypothetical protein